MKIFQTFFCVIILCCNLIANDENSNAAQLDQYKNRPKMPARLTAAYFFPSTEQLNPPVDGQIEKRPLGVISNQAVGTTIGNTTFDLQQYHSMGRQVEHRGTDWVHFAWTKQASMDYFNGRRTGYNYVDLNYCISDPPYIVHTEYGGFVSLDVDPTYSWAIPGLQSGDDKSHQFSRVYWDYNGIPLEGPNAVFTYEDQSDDAYGGWLDPPWASNGMGSMDHQNHWPKVEWQIGTETVLHMVCTEKIWPRFSTPMTCSYYRRVGPYGYQSPEIQWSGQRAIDTVMTASVTVAACPNNDDVIIAWLAPADFRRDTPDEFTGSGSPFCNDVWFAISTNQGADWVSTTTPTAPSIGSDVDRGIGGGYVYEGGNLTTYSWDSEWKAHTEISALYNEFSYPHLIWNCHRWVDTTEIYRRQSAIFHYAPEISFIRPVVKARWDTGGTCYPHFFGGDVSKITLSECDSKLYVLYSQFGNEDNPCYDVNADNGKINSELYMAASSDGGFTWDEPQNLTNTISHNCTAGDCASEHWASMARYGRPARPCEDLGGVTHVLDIVYVNDLSTGALMYDNGIWTVNDVIWHASPCREVVPWISYWDNAGDGLGECYSDNPLVVSPGGDTTITLTMENSGTDNNNFNMTVNYIDGTGWIGLSQPSGLILRNYYLDIDITLNAPPGASDPSLWKAEIEIAHDADGSPRVIPVCLMVTSSFALPESAVLATTCRRIRIFNHGRLSGNSYDESLDLIADCDANDYLEPHIYLRDASTIVAGYDEGAGSGVISYSGYDQKFSSPNSMRPISSLEVDSTTFADYSYASSEFTNHDSTVGLIASYYLPRSPYGCSYMVKELSFWNRTATQLDGILVGELVDWDIPTDIQYGISGNDSDYDENRRLIYQRGLELHDYEEGSCPIESNFRLGGIAVGSESDYKNMMTRSSNAYLLPGYGLEPDQTYTDMQTLTGYHINTDATEDIHTIVTFGEYSLPAVASPGDTFKLAMVLPTTRSGLSDLEAIVDQAGNFIIDHQLGSGWTYKVGTSTGSNVVAELGEDVTVEMENVSTAGTTEMAVTYDGPEIPGSFQTVPTDPSVYYNISTTALNEGNYIICITYDETDVVGDEADLALMHYDGGAWIDATSHHFLINNIICGTVASLSPFVIMEPEAGCCDIPGDANNDGACNIGDAVFLGNFVFRPSECATNPPIGCPPECTAEGDANADGGVNIGDQVYVNNVVFRPASCATNPPIGCPPQCGPEK